MTYFLFCWLLISNVFASDADMEEDATARAGDRRLSPLVGIHLLYPAAHEATTTTVRQFSWEESGGICAECVYHKIEHLGASKESLAKSSFFEVPDGEAVSGHYEGRSVTFQCSGVVRFCDATFHTCEGVSIVVADGLPTALNHITISGGRSTITSVCGSLNLKSPGVDIFNFGIDETGTAIASSFTVIGATSSWFFHTDK